jgi:hypothetical protein
MAGLGPADLVAEARAADAEARRHKRASNYHRQAAREARERQTELERECARLGITVTYHGEGTTPWPENQSSISQR